MKVFLAIVKLTCRSAVRSHVFRTLLFFLLLSVVLVPNTIKGDGTAYGYMQVILEYSLSVTALILSVSTVWISCSTMCDDVENARLTMIAVKPVSRVTIWLGKFTGVLFIHFVLLVISAVAIYGFVMYQYKNQRFSEEERDRLENEVFAGRRVFWPNPPDIEKLAQEELERRVQVAAERGEQIPELSTDERAAYLARLMEEIEQLLGSVPFGGVRLWEFSGLPDGSGLPLFFRYKAFSNALSYGREGLGYGIWFMRGMQPERDPADEKQIIGYTPFPLAFPADEIPLTSPKELVVPADMASIVIHEGMAIFGFQNLSKDGSTINFQPADGPKLLLRVTGFEMNYVRAILVVFMGIMTITGIACAISGCFGLPVSIFVTVAYSVVSMLAVYFTGAFGMVVAPEALDVIGLIIGHAVKFLLIPLQDFSVSAQLSTGELIEWSFIGKQFLFYVVLRGVPLCLFGIWFYYKRELGTAMKN